jgi:hypothetical protein
LWDGTSRGSNSRNAWGFLPRYAFDGHRRRGIELVFDEQRTHQDARRVTKPANLRSETPAGVVQELYALSLAHFVVRAMMFQSAASAGLDPDRLSFTGCFQIRRSRLPECDA